MLLLLGFIVLYFAQQLGVSEKESATANQAPTPPVSTLEPSITQNLTPFPTSTLTEAAAIPIGTESPRIEIPAVVETTDQTILPDIQLYGPPPNSIFSLQTPLTVYWDWPYENIEDRHFSLYLVDESGEYLAGTVNEPSLGNRGFQLNFVPADVLKAEGAYLIEIHLEQIDPFITLADSNPRAIFFTPDFPG